MDQDVMNWWLEFEEKKPEETVIDTLESQVSFGVGFYIVGLILLLIWGYLIVPATSVRKTIPPLFDFLDTVVQNQLTIKVWVYFWTLSCIPSTYISVLM